MRQARSARRGVLNTLAMLAVPAVLISGCGSKSTPSAQPASTAAEAPAATTNTATSGSPAEQPSNATSAPEALQFKASLVGGGELDATTLANGQPVLFWFWSPF